MVESADAEADPKLPPLDRLRRLPASVGQSAVTGAQQHEPRWNLLKERRLDPNRPAVGSYRRTTDFRISQTDPDAAPMRTGSGTSLGHGVSGLRRLLPE